MPAEPLNYGTAPIESATTRHNRIYTALLIAFAVLHCVGMISMFGLSLPPYAIWLFQMIVGIYGVILAMIVVTLVLRGVAPKAGQMATLALNVVLLVDFPFGTALGIYGLTMVDRLRLRKQDDS